MHIVGGDSSTLAFCFQSTLSTTASSNFVSTIAMRNSNSFLMKGSWRRWVTIFKFKVRIKLFIFQGRKSLCNYPDWWRLTWGGQVVQQVLTVQLEFGAPVRVNRQLCRREACDFSPVTFISMLSVCASPIRLFLFLSLLNSFPLSSLALTSLVLLSVCFCLSATFCHLPMCISKGSSQEILSSHWPGVPLAGIVPTVPSCVLQAAFEWPVCHHFLFRKELPSSALSV